MFHGIEEDPETFTLCYDDCNKEIQLPLVHYRKWLAIFNKSNIRLCISGASTCDDSEDTIKTQQFPTLVNATYLKRPMQVVPPTGEYIAQFEIALKLWNYLNGQHIHVAYVKEDHSYAPLHHIAYQDCICYAVHMASQGLRSPILITESDKDYIVGKWDLLTYYKCLLSSTTNDITNEYPITVEHKVDIPSTFGITKRQFDNLLDCGGSIAGGSAAVVLLSHFTQTQLTLHADSDIDVFFTQGSSDQIKEIATNYIDESKNEMKVSYQANGRGNIIVAHGDDETHVQFILLSSTQIFHKFDMNCCKVAINRDTSLKLTIGTFIDVATRTIGWGGWINLNQISLFRIFKKVIRNEMKIWSPILKDAFDTRGENAWIERQRTKNQRELVQEIAVSRHIPKGYLGKFIGQGNTNYHATGYLPVMGYDIESRTFSHRIPKKNVNELETFERLFGADYPIAIRHARFKMMEIIVDGVLVEKYDSNMDWKYHEFLSNSNIDLEYMYILGKIEDTFHTGERVFRCVAIHVRSKNVLYSK